MPTKQTSSLVDDVLTVTTETDQLDEKGLPAKGYTVTTITGTAQIEAHLRDASLRAKAPLDLVAKLKTRNDALEAAAAIANAAAALANAAALADLKKGP